MPESDFNFIWRITKYLSSLPNMSRSVAFSFERSAIFSALSRSLWKLLWIFLISSLLVENWAWMSAGRYSYRENNKKVLQVIVWWGGGDCAKQFSFQRTGVTNLRQGRNFIGHELITRSFVGIAQLCLNILVGKSGRGGKRHWVVRTGGVSMWLLGKQSKQENLQSHWRWGRS